MISRQAKRRVRVFNVLSIGVAGVFLLVLLVSNLPQANALLLTHRSVQLTTRDPSAIATESFQFNIPTDSVVGSMAFEYCDNTPVFAFSCNPPAGLDLSSANLTSQTGNTGFSIDSADSSANRLVINRAPEAGNIITSTYVFSNIRNPSASGQTEFIRISTYASTDGTGDIIDSGAVAFVTATPFDVAAKVPPYIKICVGITVNLDCTSAIGDHIALGSLTATQASAAQSQFAVGANDPNGYVVYALGPTMTSGNNTISALNNPTISIAGNSQFGINLRSNTSPAIGAEPAGPGTGVPKPDYNSHNFFSYNPGDAILSSPISTEANLITVSYLVNVNHSQPIGVYSTTITYMATAQF